MSSQNNSNISNSSSDSSNSSSNENQSAYAKFVSRYKQRRQENLLIDQMIDDATINDTFQFFQATTPVPRAPRMYINRDREEAYHRLFNDYFSNNPLFPPNMFWKRFRMRKDLFCRIVDAVTNNDDYFCQRPDATGRLSASPLQKCTAAIRLLAYGVSPDSLEEYLKISGAVARESLHHFIEGVITQFSSEYLRKPTTDDLARLLRKGEERCFPGMIGSIDCMHWEWRNCPARWRGQFQGRSKKPTLILEDVASYDLWIWHAFFGTPGSCNDINVLDRSPLFDDVFEGRAPSVCFSVNGHTYNMGYYLTDGIYPTWAAFVKSIRHTTNQKQVVFAAVQEGVRKDVERAFGVLQARFAIIRNPGLAHDRRMLGKIMKACIIMHNMIVEDERDTYRNYSDTTEFQNDIPPESSTSVQAANNVPFNFSRDRIASLSNYMSNRARVRDREVHKSLTKDLIEHIWEKCGKDRFSGN